MKADVTYNDDDKSGGDIVVPAKPFVPFSITIKVDTLVDAIDIYARVNMAGSSVKDHGADDDDHRYAELIKWAYDNGCDTWDVYEKLANELHKYYPEIIPEAC